MSTVEQRVQAIFDEAVGSDLNSWEKFEFLPGIRNKRSLSDKEEKVLRQIERKVLGSEEDE